MSSRSRAAGCRGPPTCRMSCGGRSASCRHCLTLSHCLAAYERQGHDHFRSRSQAPMSFPDSDFGGVRRVSCGDCSRRRSLVRGGAERCRFLRRGWCPYWMFLKRRRLCSLVAPGTIPAFWPGDGLCTLSGFPAAAPAAEWRPGATPAEPVEAHRWSCALSCLPRPAADGRAGSWCAGNDQPVNGDAGRRRLVLLRRRVPLHR